MAVNLSSTPTPVSRQAAIVVPDVDREFEYTDRDFARVRQLIHAHAGISLSPSKCEMVYSRLARRLRNHGIDRFTDYIDLLEREDRGGAEWQAFVNSLTTNLTSFFREAHHFPILEEHVRSLGRRQIVLWSCAASTGEEPYSMAMTMVEHFRTWEPPVKILATDLDTNVLETAASGIYPEERIEHLSKDRVKRFFMRGSGSNAGFVRVREELRKLVVFRQQNLLEQGWNMRGPFDAIFCRNVLIYFDGETQTRLLERFVPLMAPNGLLFAGHSENLQRVTNKFQLRQKTVYTLSNEARTTARHAVRTGGR